VERDGDLFLGDFDHFYQFQVDTVFGDQLFQNVERFRSRHFSIAFQHQIDIMRRLAAAFTAAFPAALSAEVFRYFWSYRHKLISGSGTGTRLFFFLLARCFACRMHVHAADRDLAV